MFTKIKRIRNLGIFEDYSWDTELPELKRYNLIYGWNGSGKSTLTDLFVAIEKRVSEKHPTLEFQIETDSGIIRERDSSSRKVRVFNEDYVSNNVQLSQGKAKPINIILGDENKEIVEEIGRDESALSEKKSKLGESTTNKESLRTRKDDKFTDVARIISSVASGRATRDYNKRNAETMFQLLSDKAILEDPDIQNYQLTLQQQIENPLTELTAPQLKYQEEELDLGGLIERVVVKAENLCAQTVESIVIDRLKENSDIREWVEKGIELHKKHNSRLCEYCAQVIPEQRMKELTSHFNEADKILKDGIDALVKVLEAASAAIGGITAKDKANLYEEIRRAYQSAVDTLEDEQKTFLGTLTKLCDLLRDKKSKATESVKLEINIDTRPLITAIEQVNVEIRKHNTKRNNFQAEQRTAQQQLEKHYLSTVYDEVKKLEETITQCENEIDRLQDGDPNNPNELGINDLKRRISEHKERMSSSHRGCAEINKHLSTFLGRDDIVFVPAETGYAINRRGNIAYNLSEGEKNAIAFVYFVVHLQDDFDIREGIVVVDDPVSSLDSNSIFQAFAFLKNAVKDAHQAFLFTHNFDFLRLLLGWFSRIGDKSCYMLKNSYINGHRSIEISKLDKLLQDHESEYHYLFKTLYSFTSDGSIESVYAIPNLARKLLDTFLMFRVPNNKNTYGKLKELEFDEIKKTAIFQFTNVQSHITGRGFDPSLVQETQKNVKYLLEMMQCVSPEHYEILERSITN